MPISGFFWKKLGTKKPSKEGFFKFLAPRDGLEPPT